MSTNEKKSTMSLDERRSEVLQSLRPDRLRNHLVSEGLELTPEQRDELNEIGKIASVIAHGLHEMSLRAMGADRKDTLQRRIRSLLGLEPQFQAILRGERESAHLPVPQITKTDVILTPDGMKIVEIEPGKIRGLGYGAMVRRQAQAPIGRGAGAVISELASNQDVAIVMSERDRFHEPEMHLLARDMEGLHVAPQNRIRSSREGLVFGQRGASMPRLAIMMTELINRGIGETEIREEARIISDRRSDLERKTALALLHNADGNEEIEAELTEVFNPGLLQTIRDVVPHTVHASQMERGNGLERSIENGDIAVFLKPITESGTRGIITPSNTNKISEILGTGRELKKFVIQHACQVAMVGMKTKEVLSGEEGESSMNIRITLHTDVGGSIIEASVVGSPDTHLAHGGTTSVITNLEPGHA